MKMNFSPLGTVISLIVPMLPAAPHPTYLRVSVYPTLELTNPDRPLVGRARGEFIALICERCVLVATLPLH